MCWNTGINTSYFNSTLSHTVLHRILLTAMTSWRVNWKTENEKQESINLVDCRSQKVSLKKTQSMHWSSTFNNYTYPPWLDFAQETLFVFLFFFFSILLEVCQSSPTSFTFFLSFFKCITCTLCRYYLNMYSYSHSYFKWCAHSPNKWDIPGSFLGGDTSPFGVVPGSVSSAKVYQIKHAQLLTVLTPCE